MRLYGLVFFLDKVKRKSLVYVSFLVRIKLRWLRCIEIAGKYSTPQKSSHHELSSWPICLLQIFYHLCRFTRWLNPHNLHAYFLSLRESEKNDKFSLISKEKKVGEWQTLKHFLTLIWKSQMQEISVSSCKN